MRVCGRLQIGSISLLVLSVLCLGWSARESEDSAAVTFTEEEIKRILQHELPAVPEDPTNKYADDPAAAHLGQFLFFDTRLSQNGEVSCATCHDPKQAFTDGRQLAVGIGEVDRHTPTLLNIAYHRWLFWDGRADTLWTQVLDPFEDEREFGSNRLKIAHAVYGDPEMRCAYEQIFGPMPDLGDTERFPRDARPVTANPSHPLHIAWESMTQSDRNEINRVFVNVGKAIAAYERRLVTAPSPFDEYVRELRSGRKKQSSSISGSAKRGLKLFIGEANCRLCHSGPMFSDGEFHNTGIPSLRPELANDAGRFDGVNRVKENPFNAQGEYSDDRKGSIAQKVKFLAASPENWGQFKTPSLRHVAQTSPYMRHGQMKSLRDVIHFYSTLEGAVPIGHHQETILQPLQLSDREVEDLMAFLESLTGDMPDNSLLNRLKSPVLEK